MLSIHMCEKMHIYFGVRILHSLRVCQIVHWVMGTTGKIPAAGSLLSKGRQYGMPNLAHMPLLCVYLPCCQLPGMSVCSVYPEKLGKENIYSKFLNGTVLPRVSHNNIRDKLVQGCNLVLMWTTQRRLDKQAAKHHGYECLIVRVTSLIQWLLWSEHL